VEAQGQANRCQIRQAIDTLTALNPIHVGNGQSVDLEILISKLVRRLALFDRFPRDVYSDEFCGKLLPARKLLPGRKLEQCASE
jgi:hypothetical protein